MTLMNDKTFFNVFKYIIIIYNIYIICHILWKYMYSEGNIRKQKIVFRYCTLVYINNMITLINVNLLKLIKINFVKTWEIFGLLV